MISENALQVRGQASAEIEAAIAKFLAGGGQIQKAPPLTFIPKPLLEPLIAPPPVIRRRRVRQEAASRQAPPPSLKEISEVEAARRERDAQLGEMAKTMTADEACEAIGINKRALVAIGRRRGFKFLLGSVNNPQRDAKNIERILAMKTIGVSRSQCCKRMGISMTLLNRLVILGNVDYPASGPGRPRK